MFDRRQTILIVKQNKRVNRGAVVLLLFLCIGFPCLIRAQNKKKPMSDDEAEIRAVEKRFIAAFNAGDIDAMMKSYVPDKSFVIFDVVPRKEYRGADVYRKDWEEFFLHFKGRPTITISNLGITADDQIGFSHSIQRIKGVDIQGLLVDRTVRVTDGYRKVGGKWLIALEHVSVPVDPGTGKAEMGTKS